jgi:CheY-like chemotaxis protein
MDIQMPVMDGLTATMEIRKLPQFKSIPIMAMTAHAMAGEDLKSYAAGMNEHITKPINPEILYNTLIKYLVSEDKMVHDSSTPQPIQSNEIEVVESFPSIEGLNVEQGLARVNGKVATYCKILASFVHTYKNQEEVSNKYKSENDLSGLSRLYHTIAGVCGNLGNETLYKKAQILSSAYKSAKSIDELWTETVTFNKELTLLINDIEKVLDQINSEKVTIQKIAIDENELQAMIEEILKRTKENDPTASELTEKVLNEYDINPDTREILSKANLLLLDFEYDDAITNLEIALLK